MGRHAEFRFTFADRLVPYGLINRKGIYRVRFWGPGPDGEDKYYDLSTGCRTENDAHIAAAKIALKVFNPPASRNLKRATWDRVLDDLAATWGLRPESLEVYRSIVRMLRTTIETKGPSDVTPEVATQFMRRYATGKYKRSKSKGGREYSRSAKTVENAARRLSGLWTAHLGPLGYVSDNPWVKVTRPTVPKKAVRIPPEDTVRAFFTWLADRYPEWELIRLFVEIKAMSGCRTFDLCQVRSSQLAVGTLTIDPEQDKTHRERVIPLPVDVYDRLSAIRGDTYLWERYAADAKRFRPGSRNRDEFSPRTLYWCVNNLFREFSDQHSGPRLRPHDLRKRAITLTVAATQSVDATAQAIGIDPMTARKYYLEAGRAFEGSELMKRMAAVLRPGVTR